MDYKTRLADILVAGWQGENSVEWPLMHQYAEKQRLSPCLYMLYKQGKINLPVSIAKLLHRSYVISNARNAVLFKELINVINALNSYGIEGCLLKGIDLASGLYPQSACRPMGDIDLLLHYENVAQAEIILGKLGYHRAPYQNFVRKWGWKYLEYHLHLTKSDSIKPSLELHWRILGGIAHEYSASAELLWDYTRLSQRSIDGKEVSVRSMLPELVLPYLMVHLALHREWEEDQLIWYYDILMALRQWGSTLDYGLMKKIIRRFNWELPVGHITREIADLFKIKLPVALEEFVVGRYHDGRRPKYNSFIAVTGWKDSVRSLSHLNFTGKMMAILLLVFPSMDYMRFRYQIRSPLLVYVYYPYRWLSFLWRGITKSFKYLFGKQARQSSNKSKRKR